MLNQLELAVLLTVCFSHQPKQTIPVEIPPKMFGEVIVPATDAAPWIDPPPNLPAVD
jgi:hypothetical protein